MNLLRARNCVAFREAFAWVLVALLLGGHFLIPSKDCTLRGPGFKTNSDGSACICGKDGYCLCTPNLAVDVVVEVSDHENEEAPPIVLVRRRDSGKYATIGGFVEVGESVEETVQREVLEETGLQLEPGSARLLSLFSDPHRDHRRHTVSVVWTARVASLAGLRAGDDAKAVEVVEASRLTSLDFAFDHALLVSDYLELKKHKSFPEKRSKPWHRRSSCPL
jgi:8-oxo-dGTP diphosphatase